jgi:hypothetical protein
VTVDHVLLAALVAERQDYRWFPTPPKRARDINVPRDDEVTCARRRKALLDDDMQAGRWVSVGGIKVWEETGRCKPADECRCGHKRVRPPVEKGGEARGHRPGCDACDCSGFDPWQVNRWPLIEMGFRRGDTIRWFGENGHPTPPRSACWFCPHSRNPRWVTLKAEHPDLFERACQLDETIREGGGFNARGNVAFAGRMFLHDSLMPLREADLRSAFEKTVDGGQGDLFDGTALGLDCETGVCFT